MLKKKAQSILEYTLLLAVIIGIIVLVLYRPNTGIGERIEKTYDKMGDVIQNVTDELTEKVFGL